MELVAASAQTTSPNFRFLTQAIGRLSDEIYVNEATPDLQKSFLDALSKGQILSKLKVLEILSESKQSYANAIIIGSWTGLLPYMLNMEGLVQSADGVEISPIWAKISERVNRDWKWTSTVADACQEQFWIGKKPQIVINTSTEHMSYKWLDYVEKGTHVLIQSTNYVIDEHVNRADSLDELIRSTKLSQIISTANQELHFYNRFTVFGIK